MWGRSVCVCVCLHCVCVCVGVCVHECVCICVYLCLYLCVSTCDIRWWKLIFECGKTQPCQTRRVLSALRVGALHEGSETGHKSRTHRVAVIDRRRRESDFNPKQSEKPCLETLRIFFAEPRDKVVCKLCMLQWAYHWTTSNMKSHLVIVHPNERGILRGTPTKQPRLDTSVYCLLFI